MKIRTITTGFNLEMPLSEKQIKQITDFTKRVQSEYTKQGYEVQTLRIVTQPWEEYVSSPSQIKKWVQDFEQLSQSHGIHYFNIGTTCNAENIPLIYDLIQLTSTGFCTVMVADQQRTDYVAARKTAELIKKLASVDKDGFTNLRFAAVFNTEAGSPFFPAAFHQGPVSFGIGTENSDLVRQAFSKAENIQDAQQWLVRILETEFKKIENIARDISDKEGISYNGIDVSIAPSVDEKQSIAYAFEKLGLGRFGEVGTLAVAKCVTDSLSCLDIKKCGYSGLMLPVLEDFGLAVRNKEKKFNITDILLYSAVCGTGLDTIPLPGDVSTDKLFALLLDIASLSNKLDKPLSARLMPVPHKKSGEMTSFSFDYFANTDIMEI
ncbi:MAG: DUF711 family protein [Candidatus Aminicenantes bacterium]|nr:DUF711 family protein [Candidatus Aminicenantes bacterium]